MDFGFKPAESKKMYFKHHLLEQHFLFGTSTKMGAYPQSTDLYNSNLFKDFMEGFSNKGPLSHFKYQAKKEPNTIFASVPLVGGFVGSKSQAGGSNRALQVMNLWEVIAKFLSKKDLAKESLGNNLGSKQPEAFKGNCCKCIKTPNMTAKTGKSYADVAKSGPISEKSCEQCEIKSEKLPLCKSSVQMTGLVLDSVRQTENNKLVDPNNMTFQCNIVFRDAKCSESCNNSTDSKTRSLSECSIDSDDSFIVFENNDEETSSIDSYSDDSSSDEDEIDCSRLNAACEGFPEIFPTSSHLYDANLRWEKCYSTSRMNLPKKVKNKKVSFAKGKDLTKVQKIVVWDYAYRLARKGPWEEMARDTARFKERIRKAEEVLAPVLTPAHRHNVYHQRFCSSSHNCC